MRRSHVLFVYNMVPSGIILVFGIIRILRIMVFNATFNDHDHDGLLESFKYNLVLVKK